MQRNYTIPRLRRAFELYKHFKHQQILIVLSRQDGKIGICYKHDHAAERWQSLDYRIYKLDQWITREKMDMNYYTDLWKYQSIQKKKQNLLEHSND